MENLSEQTQHLFLKLCVVWSCVVTSWAILSSTVPLILKDVVGASRAAEWLGIFTATTAFSGMILASLLGHFSDRFGRIEMLLPWLVVYFLANVGVVYGDIRKELFPLWLARLPALSIPGAVLFALASDVGTGSTVLRLHGMFGASSGVALLIGGFTCGVVSKHFSRSSALSVAVLFSAAAALATSLLVKAAPAIPRRSTVDSYRVAAFYILRKDPLLRNLIVSFSLVRVANVNLYFMFVIFANYKLKWDVFDTSIALGLNGSLGVFWQFFGLKFIVQKFDNVVPVLIGFVCCSQLVMLAIGLAATSTQMYCATIMYSMYGMMSSIFTAKISVLGSEAGIAGLSLGLVATLQNSVEIWLAVAFGKILGWTMLNYSPAHVLSGLPFFCNSVVLMLAAMIVVHGHHCHGQQRMAWIHHGDDDVVSDFKSTAQ